MGCAPSPNSDGYVHPDEQRLAAFHRVYESYLVVDDIYPDLARRFLAEGTSRFAEVGGGRGPVGELLRPPLTITKIGAEIWARK